MGTIVKPRNYMKLRLNLVSIVLAGCSVCLAASFPVRADETNDANQTGRPKKEAFFFKGGNPFDFILAMDRHFRMRLGEILSIPSSLARAEVPRMRVSTDNPGEVLALYNRLQDPLLGQWHYEPEVKEAA